jgi:3-dehydroquinate synthase II
MVEVSDLSDVPLFFGALEHGVDGIVLDPATPGTIVQLRKLLDGHGSERLALADARIVEVRNLGMGDRVCIDTCSLLQIGEGMLIGSQSTGLFLVHSESVGSEYVGTRPFRVNAGPVQSYVLGPGDRTPYLSDLRVGDEVLAVDRDGSTRPVIIGRLKVERRPLILISAELEGRTYNIILQNAETVRLISGDEPVSLVDLKVGDPVKVLASEGGRHFGTRIKETILEK